MTAVLPLITPEDLAEIVQGCPPDQHAYAWAHQRDIRRVVRLVKAGLANPGWRLLLAQSDLALLINRTFAQGVQCSGNQPSDWTGPANGATIHQDCPGAPPRASSSRRGGN